MTDRAMRIENVVVGILAAWRLTHLLHAEDGPWELFFQLRRGAATSFWGQVLGCFYCLSLWVALPLALLLSKSWRERGMIWLGLSGGAILLERASSTLPIASFVEDSE